MSQSQGNLKHIPSLKQYKKWSIPSKVGYIGFILTVFGFFWGLFTFFYPSNDSDDGYKQEVIIGKWKSSETLTKLMFFRMLIKSEIEFIEDGKFTSEAVFNIMETDYFKIKYHGNWSIEDRNLMFTKFKIDTVIHDERYNRQGIDGYNFTMIQRQYLNYQTGLKLEEIKSWSPRVIKTVWRQDNYEIERMYVKSE